MDLNGAYGSAGLGQSAYLALGGRAFKRGGDVPFRN